MIKVLIVDDDPITRKGIKLLMPFSSYAMEVVADVSDGQKALELLKDIAVDLVLVDIEMPVMDGVTFIETARPLYPHLNYVILTMHTEFNLLQKMLRLGVIDYIVKTEFDKENFHSILERIAGKISKPALELPDNSYSKETTHDILKIKNYIDNHFSKSIIVSDMAQKANLSYGYFSHSFRDIVGVSFSDYLINIRIEKAKEYLTTTHQSISQISKDVGYTDEKYFSRVFKKITGYTPSGYRNKCF
jgi:two-component system response regulator YesN